MHPLHALLDQVNHLKQLPRTGWLLANVSQPESVADHTAAMAILTLFLAETVNGALAENGLAAPLDVSKVVRLALLHDLAESELTDLPKRASQLVGADAKHRAEAKAMSQILAGLPDADGYLALWSEYDAGETPEARLVKDADKLEMVHQAKAYARRGHLNLDEFWQGHEWNFPASRDLFVDLTQS
ncbi:MAG: HD domain-containing protein [Caldilineaceae bacterium]|nr:HD domain-containing protein [Caldilineaceae bacterium]MBP8110372.1 HD domain-containing protein [Caldilineaceae bacterium]MBP8124836.1 HD domain-containing protein [Caldilineaceae bacterium]MBP9073788.1 HD domain-containing protein [Caldilineaceae bacterium]